MHTDSLFLDLLFYLTFSYVVIKFVKLLSMIKKEYIATKTTINLIKCSLEGLNTNAREISNSLQNLNTSVNNTQRVFNNGGSGLSSVLQATSQIATTLLPIVISGLSGRSGRGEPTTQQTTQPNVMNEALAREIFNRMMRTGTVPLHNPEPDVPVPTTTQEPTLFDTALMPEATANENANDNNVPVTNPVLSDSDSENESIHSTNRPVEEVQQSAMAN